MLYGTDDRSETKNAENQCLILKLSHEFNCFCKHLCSGYTQKMFLLKYVVVAFVQ